MADLEFEAPKAASLKKADFINREIEYSNFRYMFGGLDLSGARSSFVKGSSFIDPKASAKYSTAKIRWFMLFQFAMSLASTTFQMMSFASISSVIASIFEVDSVVVNFNVMVYLFAFVLFNFASISAIEFSTKWTFKICAIANIVGSWGKWFALYATSNFYYLVVVQTFLACFQPFLGNGASKVASSHVAQRQSIAEQRGVYFSLFAAWFAILVNPFERSAMRIVNTFERAKNLSDH